MYGIVGFLLLFFMVSCSPEKPADVGGQQTQRAAGGPPVVGIAPVDATRDTAIYLIPHGFDISDAKVEWLINGVLVEGQTTGQFKSEMVRKGDKVTAKVVIEGREILSNVVEIRNSLPTIASVKLLPEIFKPGDTLSVDASGKDADEDDVILSYEWTKNGEPAGNDKQIGSTLKRGDKIDVRITPYDGEAYGQPVILHKEIVNLPPAIAESDTFDFSSNIYTYQVHASDPDGDALTYSLKSAPSGMVIDPSTGLVRWNVPRGFRGRAAFVVSVSDGHDGTASQELYVNIKPL